MSIERILRRTLVAVAVFGLAAGILARVGNRPDLAGLLWTIATAPVAAALAIFIVRELWAGRFGVDAIALLSMTAVLVLGEPLAGAVVGLMYLEDIAVLRAEHDLRSLVDRAPNRAWHAALKAAGIQPGPARWPLDGNAANGFRRGFIRPLMVWPVGGNWDCSGFGSARSAKII
jgi:hypothetical protein